MLCEALLRLKDHRQTAVACKQPHINSCNIQLQRAQVSCRNTARQIIAKVQPTWLIRWILAGHGHATWSATRHTFIPTIVVQNFDS